MPIGGSLNVPTGLDVAGRQCFLASGPDLSMCGEMSDSTPANTRHRRGKACDIAGNRHSASPHGMEPQCVGFDIDAESEFLLDCDHLLGLPGRDAR